MLGAVAVKFLSGETFLLEYETYNSSQEKSTCYVEVELKLGLDLILSARKVRLAITSY